MTIPADFSADLVSAGGDDPTAAQIDVTYNDANSFIGTTLGRSAMDHVRDAVAATAGEQAVDQVLVGLGSARDGMLQAADGALSLRDASTQLERRRRSRWPTARRDARDGAAQLADGAATLDDGAGTVAGGADAARRRAPRSCRPARTDGGRRRARSLADGRAGGRRRRAHRHPAGRHRRREAARARRRAHPGRRLPHAPAPPRATRTPPRSWPAWAARTCRTRRRLGDDRPAPRARRRRRAGRRRRAAAQHRARHARRLVGTLSAGASPARLRRRTQAADGADDARRRRGVARDGHRDARRRRRPGGRRDRPARRRRPAARRRADRRRGADPRRHRRAAHRPRRRPRHAGRASTTSDVAPAASLGEGFAPLFIPLALFVGGLITWLLLRPLPTRALATPASGWRVALAGYLPVARHRRRSGRCCCSASSGSGSGLSIGHPVGTVAFLLLVAATFLAVQQMLIAGARLRRGQGRRRSRCSCCRSRRRAAPTPSQTTPAFFQAIHPLLPMTYAVGGLRDLITGTPDARLWTAVAYLVGRRGRRRWP